MKTITEFAPDTLTLGELTFEPMLRQEELLTAIESYAAHLNARFADEPPVLLPVLTGAYRLFAELVQRLRVPYQVDFIKLSSYGKGTESSGRVEMQLPLSLKVRGRRVVVLEDIVDTGHTSDYLHRYLMGLGAAEVEFYSLLYKKDNFRGQHPPSAYGFIVPPAFVVGFGLDYAEEGRWLPHIYRRVGE